jgi:hypothetical protein
MRGIEPLEARREIQLPAARSRDQTDRGGSPPGDGAFLQAFERGSHRPCGFAGGDDREMPRGKRIENSSGYSGGDETSWLDALDPCTKDVLQVGAEPGQKISQ